MRYDRGMNVISSPDLSTDVVETPDIWQCLKAYEGGPICHQWLDEYSAFT